MLNFTKKHKIKTMPIKLDLIETEQLLEDGTKKMRKKLKGFDFQTVTVNDFDQDKVLKKRWDFYENGNQIGVWKTFDEKGKVTSITKVN